MSQVAGRVAVVTGGASGMGLAVARRLAADGDRVGILDLNGDAAQQVASELRDEGHSAVAAQVDVSNRQAVEDALQKVRSEFGPIEIMVTSAGLDEFAKFTDITAQMWDRMIAVNLTGTFHCVQAAVPDMLAGNWGRIVMISSSSAQSGAKRMAHYVASKGGVLGADQGPRARARAQGHHRQHHPARLHPDADDRSRPGKGRSARPAAGDRLEPDAARRDGRRHRRSVRVPVLGRGRLHHRSGAERQRRLVRLR